MYTIFKYIYIYSKYILYIARSEVIRFSARCQHSPIKRSTEDRVTYKSIHLTCALSTLNEKQMYYKYENIRNEYTYSSPRKGRQRMK